MNQPPTFGNSMYDRLCEGREMSKRRVGEFNKAITGCQPKTFILMVKPLKPLFFSEKPLKTFIFLRKTFIFRKSWFFQYSGCQDPIKSYIFRNVLFCPIF